MNNSNKFFDRLALIFCLAGFFGWAALLTNKYYLFGYYDWDLALAAQTMWNLAHGSTFVSLYGTHFLANHAELFAFLLTPLYAVFPHPLTLVYLKLAVFFTGGFFIYRIGKEKVTALLSFLVMILYFIHPANVYMLLYEFHFESLGIIFVILMFYFFFKNQFKPFIFCGLLLCLLKENLPAIVFMFGFLALFVKQTPYKKWSLSPIILGLGYFLFVMYVLIPYFRKDFHGGQSLYWSGLFQEAGGSPAGILLNFVQHPIIFLQKVFTQPKITYLADLFGPLCFIPFFSPHILLIAAPIIAQNLLTNLINMHSVHFQYNSTIMPVIFLAFIFSLHYLQKKVSKHVFWGVIAVVSILSICNFLNYYPRWKEQIISWQDHYDPIRQEMVGSIDSKEGVITSFEFLHPLSGRNSVYAFYNVWNNTNYFTQEKPLKLRTPVSTALINFMDPWLMGQFLDRPEEISRNINQFFEKNWSVERQVEDLVLFRKNESIQQKLVIKNPVINQENWQTVNLLVDKSLNLDKIKLEHDSESVYTTVKFLWRAQEKLNKLYVVSFIVSDSEGKIYYNKDRIIGYFIYPTSFWSENESVFDQYVYWTRDLPKGIYQLNLRFYELQGYNFMPVSVKIEGKAVSEELVSIGALTIK